MTGDTGKSQIKRGRGHEEITIHTYNITVCMFYNPFPLVLLGLPWLGFVRNSIKMEQTELGILLLENEYFLKYEDIPSLVRWRPTQIYPKLSSSSTESKTKSYIRQKIQFYHLEKKKTKWCFHQDKGWLRWTKRQECLKRHSMSMLEMTPVMLTGYLVFSLTETNP